MKSTSLLIAALLFAFLVFRTSAYAADAESKDIDYKTYNFVELENVLRDSELEITLEEQMAINTYSDKEDTYYKEINSFLRSDYLQTGKDYAWDFVTPKDAQRYIKNIDQLFKKLKPLPRDLVVFRGVGLKFHNNKFYSVGEEFVDAAFVSTSTSLTVAKNFLKEGQSDSLFIIYSNNESNKGILIGKGGEEEVLFPHGERFRVMTTISNNKGTIDVNIVQRCSLSCETKMPSNLNSILEKTQKSLFKLFTEVKK